MPRAQTVLRSLAVMVILLLTYTLTRPSYLSLTHGTDGGDLTVAASTFGIAHPPGYGLYTLTASVVSRIIPGDSAVQRMQIFSHFTAIMLSVLVGTLAASSMHDPERRPQIFTAAALLCGWSRPVWEQALMIEVYLFLAVLLAGILIVVQKGTACRIQGMARHAPTFLMGHLIGLAITHHLTALLWLPGLVILIIYKYGRSNAFHVLRTEIKGGSVGTPFLASERADSIDAVPTTSVSMSQTTLLRPYISMLLGIISGFWPWLYLILRAGQVPQANWGGIEQGTAAFIGHITAQDYRVFLQLFSFEAILKGIVQWVTMLPEQVTPFGVVLLIIGLIVTLRDRERRIQGIVFVICVICVAGFTGLYRAPETQAAYTLTLIIPVVMITTQGLMSLIRAFSWVIREVIVWWLPLVLFATFASSLNRQNDVTGVNFLTQVTRLAPENAIVLVERDGETFLLWAAQQGGWRPDVTIVNGTLLNYDWYAESLARLWPNLLLKGSSQAERLHSLYTTSRPLIAPRLIRPPAGVRSLPLGEGWYCLTRTSDCKTVEKSVASPVNTE